MNNIKTYIESGILEMYVLGLTNPQETNDVNAMLLLHPEIALEMDAISQALINYGNLNTPAVNPSLLTFLMASIDYTERIKNGEVPTYPPLLNENSKIEDYNDWLLRPDMTIPKDFNQAHAKIIGFTEQAKTAILWVQTLTPPELHDNEFEKFLIVEGTCNITIGETVHQLVPGNFLAIPLHVVHQVKVTSAQPCKVILQRVAA